VAKAHRHIVGGGEERHIERRHKDEGKKSSKNFVPVPARHSLGGGGRLCAFVPSFTLIELLVVMVVISILVGITIPVSRYVSYRARMANQQVYVEKIKSALEDYRAAYGEYPITPSSNFVNNLPENYPEAKRHYDDIPFPTECASVTQGPYSLPGFGNSPYTNVNLSTNTLEIMGNVTNDYCLTYPLMLRQLHEGARPFMEFEKKTVAHILYKPKATVGADAYKITKWFKTIAGTIVKKETYAIRGNPINRYKAVDPVSMNQWKYYSYDGVTYTLTTNDF
jgi:prepilin-type N-terminal cleavage/methylation domain-containing protein